MAEDRAGMRARLATALELARVAGPVANKYYQQQHIGLEIKPDNSPVTLADRETEKAMRQVLARAHPEDGILGEEFGEQIGTSGYRWILDPIDGTQVFTQGVPLFGNLVACESGGESILGVINMPILNEMVYALKGEGAWHVGRSGVKSKARVSQKKELKDAVFVYSNVTSWEKDTKRAGAHAALRAAVSKERGWGDCYGYLLVATGRADIMIDPKFSIWDAAALKPIIEEAGGRFTDWSGVPRIDGGEGVATNGFLHAAVIAITSKYPS